MTLIQKAVLSLLPKRWSAAIQAESESWLLRCSVCGTARSVWEAGGIRFGAASVGKRVAIWCPTCGRIRVMVVERRSI
jgi:hypothetical protein